MDSSPEQPALENWNVASPEATVQQISDLLAGALQPINMGLHADKRSFEGKCDDSDPRQGIRHVHGELNDRSDVIVVWCELLAPGTDVRVSTQQLFTALSKLEDRCRPSFREDGDGQQQLGVELRIQAAPLGVARENSLLLELTAIDDLAKTLQEDLPTPWSDAELERAYKDLSVLLKPIMPFPVGLGTPASQTWADEVMCYLRGGLSVALVGTSPVALSYALTALARAAGNTGSSLGYYRQSAVGVKGLLELAEKAPGVLVLPASTLRLGSNPYEMNDEISAALALLERTNRPVVFTGTLGELQGVFHGGQGGDSNPLVPVVTYPPEPPLAELVQFALAAAGQTAGGLPQGAGKQLATEIQEAISDTAPDEPERLLPALATSAVAEWRKSAPGNGSTSDFAAKLSTLAETLSGLSTKPSRGRSPAVQKRLVQKLTTPDLGAHFKSRLFAQDDALDELCARLAGEALARPAHQPLRYCAQGAPGTGKSKSAEMLAEWLNMPYIHVDMASIPDAYTGSSQFFGSGRGIVNSNRPGRLEQAAKHHLGAVVEVADLDHATPAVRCVMADQFLQILETGIGQSATGASFSCDRLVFVFTMNLPGQLDDTVRKRIGFGGGLTRQEVAERVTGELGKIVSKAFLSRVGSPILFDMLNVASVALIAERQILESLRLAAARTDLGAPELRLQDGLGEQFLRTTDLDLDRLGARELQDVVRIEVTRSFVAALRATALSPDRPWLVGIDDTGHLRMQNDNDSTPNP